MEPLFPVPACGNALRALSRVAAGARPIAGGTLRKAVRIAFVLPVLLLAISWTVPLQAQVVDPALARQTLENSTDRILGILSNPNYVNPVTRAPLRRQIEDEVWHIFDFGEFSARTIGEKWKTLSPGEREAFINAFAELLFSTYLSHVEGYDGEEVRYVGERRSKNGDRVEIATEISMKDGRVVPISYRMLCKEEAVGGAWVVYDVLIEGVSLVGTYRAQFREELARAGIGELIGKVRKKAMEAVS